MNYVYNVHTRYEVLDTSNTQTSAVGIGSIAKQIIQYYTILTLIKGFGEYLLFISACNVTVSELLFAFCQGNKFWWRDTIGILDCLVL